MTNRTVFQVLDLDRTLFDTSKLAHFLKEIIVRHNPQLVQDIDAEIIKHAQRRTSFFIFEYIAGQIGEDNLRDCVYELHQAVSAAELLLPGAIERIEFARSQPGWSTGILTFGSRRDQMIKLKLVGLQLERHLITDSPSKGDVIAAWQLPDGRFQLPLEFGGQIVDTVTLDDDKLIAFENLPVGSYGQWVTHASIGGASELPPLPSNVQPVGDLAASVRYLQTKLDSL